MVSCKYNLKSKEIYKRHTSKKDKKTYLFYVGVDYLCGKVLMLQAKGVNQNLCSLLVLPSSRTWVVGSTPISFRQGLKE